jgi:hypothetical protein
MAATVEESTPPDIATAIVRAPALAGTAAAVPSAVLGSVGINSCFYYRWYAGIEVMGQQKLHFAVCWTKQTIREKASFNFAGIQPKNLYEQAQAS